MPLAGYNVVVTGAARGLGAAGAHGFAAAGARVVLADVDEAGARAAAQAIEAGGARAMAVRCDIADAADCERLVGAAEGFFDAPVDVFLAHAGVGFIGALHEAPVDAIRRAVEVNVLGSIFSARAALRSLTRSSRASLIFTSSLQGVQGRGLRSVYTATKHALVGLTRSLALEYGPQGVRVNAIGPASTDTPHWRAMLARTTDDVDGAIAAVAASLPLQRLPTPEDFAAAAVFLASPAARAITGHTLLVDCGAAAGKM